MICPTLSIDIINIAMTKKRTKAQKQRARQKRLKQKISPAFTDKKEPKNDTPTKLTIFNDLSKTALIATLILGILLLIYYFFN
jgi:hypothetical protein